MALVRNAANTLRKGRIGETTYYASKGRQIARQALNNSNYGESARRSLAQQTRRVKWANLVNFYKLCSRWMPKAFESKKPGQTDYNKFMQLNINTQRVALTRDQAINGGCVADAFAITQGTIAPCNLGGLSATSRLGIGSTFNPASTDPATVGQLAQALIENNADVVAGMQLSLVIADTSIDGAGIPRTAVQFMECVLNPESTELLSAYFGGELERASDNTLTCGAIAHGGKPAAFILSQLTDTGLKVSSETLAGTFTMAEQFSTAAVVDAAIETYGLDKEVILNPDSAEPIV